MAVEAPEWLKNAVRWRWTPTVALIGGSLAFVALAAAFVPSEFDFTAKTPADGPTGALEGAAAPGTPEEAAAAPKSARSRRRQAMAEAAANAVAPAPPAEGAPAPQPTFVKPFIPDELVPPPPPNPNAVPEEPSAVNPQP